MCLPHTVYGYCLIFIRVNPPLASQNISIPVTGVAGRSHEKNPIKKLLTEYSRQFC